MAVPPLSLVDSFGTKNRQVFWLRIIIRSAFPVNPVTYMNELHITAAGPRGNFTQLPFYPKRYKNPPAPIFYEYLRNSIHKALRCFAANITTMNTTSIVLYLHRQHIIYFHYFLYMRANLRQILYFQFPKPVKHRAVNIQNTKHFTVFINRYNNF